MRSCSTGTQENRRVTLLCGDITWQKRSCSTVLQSVVGGWPNLGNAPAITFYFSRCKPCCCCCCWKRTVTLDGDQTKIIVAFFLFSCCCWKQGGDLTWAADDSSLKLQCTPSLPGQTASKFNLLTTRTSRTTRTTRTKRTTRTTRTYFWKFSASSFFNH